MSYSIFRPVEFWKASLMTWPDNVFFDLMRTVFGKIKTPFNKQFILNDLEIFFSQKNIQNNIAAYLDQKDSLIIAAIATLQNPSSVELEEFFADEINGSELNSLIGNLEERFIIYRFKENRENRLSLNPVLEPVLSPIASNRTLLFETVPQNESDPGKIQENNFIFDDRILAAILSFISHNETFYRKGGGIRQKLLNEIGTIFPGISIEAIIGGLRVLGLFTKDGERLLPDYQRFSEFGNLSERERAEYCAAGIYCFCHIWIGHSFSSRLLRNKFSDLAAYIHIFLDTLNPDCLYTKPALRRIVYILSRNNQEDFFKAFVDALEKTNLLIRESNRYWRLGNTFKQTNSPASPDKAVIATDSPFSFFVYPEITYNDVTALASFSLIAETGAAVRFEMNRDSVTRAFNQGISAGTIIELLQRLSHNRIDGNMVFTIKDWEKRYREIRLLSGTILTLSPEHRYLAETQPLAGLITETIAPGIYLLPYEAEEKAAAALRKTGTAIFTGAGKNKGVTVPDGRLFKILADNFYTSLQSDTVIRQEHTVLPKETRKKSPPAASRPAADLTGDFYSILEKMRLGKEENEELSARINRRMILCEAQLKDANIRYEKTEAGGMDYSGKLMIAKQAVIRQESVEIHLSGKKKDGVVFGIAKSLEKAGDENILIVECFGDTALQGAALQGAVRVPLGKISLLRRIKKTIFDN